MADRSMVDCIELPGISSQYMYRLFDQLIAPYNPKEWCALVLEVVKGGTASSALLCTLHPVYEFAEAAPVHAVTTATWNVSVLILKRDVQALSIVQSVPDVCMCNEQICAGISAVAATTKIY